MTVCACVMECCVALWGDLDVCAVVSWAALVVKLLDAAGKM
jgi:hypothetical protein